MAPPVVAFGFQREKHEHGVSNFFIKVEMNERRMMAKEAKGFGRP
jgi:hypothetical protein